jgi:NAD-dependent dihydropyrimidine dehydrogenase PreA subunit
MVIVVQIDEDKCIKCQTCIPYCPVDAIHIESQRVVINQDLCVECAACLKSGACTQLAIYQPTLKWPRILRSQFSDPLVRHPITGISGRGTAEMKTNDVTKRFIEGDIGFAIEIGRPGISTSFADVEQIAQVLASHVEFEPLNPVTQLLDPETGKFRDETILNERVLSAIIECKTTASQALNILHRLKTVASTLDTVFSLCVISRCQGTGIPFKGVMEAAGFQPRLNGKTNVGLGRPLQ